MKFEWKESPGLKVGVIGLLMLVLTLPSSLIVRLIEERQARQTEACRDISSTWGGDQKLSGPILVIPYQVKGMTGHLKLLPEEWILKGDLQPELRRRGLFSSALYDADLQLDGRFAVPGMAECGLPEEALLRLDQALLVVTVTQQRSLAGAVEIKIDGKPQPLRPGLPAPLDRKDAEGFHVRLDPGIKKEFGFALRCHLHGSGSFGFLPSGRRSEIELSSSWRQPSYFGAYSAKHEESESGFRARWSVQDLQRGFAQSWLEDRLIPSQDLCGVELYQSNDVYQRIWRMSRYALMFLCFTFAGVFILERVKRVRVHPLQYLLVGFAALLFNVLLLAFAEHFGFNLGYLAAACLIVIIAGAYCAAVFRSRAIGLAQSGILAALYAFLYGTLQLEDYALLMGSLGLFAILAVVMFVTRSLNREEETLGD
ncbi:MAG: hypothetical protein RL095_3397 [Verrucomicrobiota bacterium]|jgi:inner membrane protein